MGEPARQENPQAATYEDILALPEHVVGEIIDGVLYVSARPAQPHAFASTILSSLLVAPFHRGVGEGGVEGPGGWWILNEPELHFWTETRRQTLVPDVAGWRRERLPRLTQDAAFTLAPDWVCEVASPRTAGLDRVHKMRVYAREGVRHVWILDPLGESLEVFRLQGEFYAFVAGFLGRETVRAEPFDAVPLDLSLLWLPEEPPAPADGSPDAPPR
jgi:Uma2 family endonuclease